MAQITADAHTLASRQLGQYLYRRSAHEVCKIAPEDLPGLWWPPEAFEHLQALKAETGSYAPYGTSRRVIVTCDTHTVTVCHLPGLPVYGQVSRFRLVDADIPAARELCEWVVRAAPIHAWNTILRDDVETVIHRCTTWGQVRKCLPGLYTELRALCATPYNGLFSEVSSSARARAPMSEKGLKAACDRIARHNDAYLYIMKQAGELSEDYLAPVWFHG